MKIDLVIFLRHLTNLDVLQKGWNYPSIRLMGTKPLNARLMEEGSFPLELSGDRRDPQRFFDPGHKEYSFSQNSCTLHMPAVRIEYFDQQVMLNKVFKLELDTDESQLLVVFQINFKHFPGQVDAVAPPIQECKTIFSQTWTLRHPMVPCVQPVVEVFKDIHLAALETVFAWCGQGLEQRRLFREIYGGQTFGDACDSMESSKNLRQLISQAIQQRVKLSQNRENVASLRDEDVREALRRAQLKEFEKLRVQFPNEEPLGRPSSPGEDSASTDSLHAPELETGGLIVETDVIDNPALVKQTETILLEDVELDTSATDVLDATVRQPESDAVRMRLETKAMRRVMLHDGRAVGSSRLFTLCRGLDANRQPDGTVNTVVERYTQEQLTFLEKLRETQQRQLRMLKRYSLLEPRDVETRRVTVFVMVHGYKGSQHDFRLLRDLLQYECLALQEPAVFIQLDYYQAEDTRVFQLGLDLAAQLRRKLVSSLAAGSWCNTLRIIKEINFVGFSLGNVVVESLLASLSLDPDELEQMDVFLRSYDAASTEERSKLMRRYRTSECILAKLNRFYSINGPLLGQTQTNGLVGLGMGFLKTAGRGRVNACLRDLENTPIGREELREFQSLWFVRELLALRTAHPRPAGLCTQATTEAFPRAWPLDLLAYASRLACFRQVYCLGSAGDGYVGPGSALLQQSQPEHGFLIQKYDGCEVHLLLIAHAPEKFAEAPRLDRATGRAVHLCPLMDLEVCQEIADLILEGVLVAWEP